MMSYCRDIGRLAKEKFFKIDHGSKLLFCEGKNVARGKDKSRKKQPSPSEVDLRDAICDILREVDFNTVGYTAGKNVHKDRYHHDTLKSVLTFLLYFSLFFRPPSLTF